MRLYGVENRLRITNGYEYANVGNESSEMSELRLQISDTVIASEERAWQSHSDLDCFGLRPRNDVGYGVPALGIEAITPQRSEE